MSTDYAANFSQIGEVSRRGCFRIVPVTGAGSLLAPQRLPGDELLEEFCARETKNFTDFAALPPAIQEETSARRVIFLKAAQPAQVCRSDLGGVFDFQRGEATGAVDDEIDLDAGSRPPIK